MLLTRAGIEPPYILLGESFGSYNMCLYAHTFPEKVKAMILTGGLHESGILNLLKIFNQLRDKMHHHLSLISTEYTEIIATRSSHFVWIDEPEIIIQAVANLLR